MGEGVPVDAPSRPATVDRDAPLLQLRGITKAFPGVVAVDAVDLELRAGEVHALMGENGAGKSTLMKVVAGVVRHDAGQVLLEGRPVSLATPADAQRHGIHTVFQELTVLDNLDVGRNLLLGHEPMRGPLVDFRQLYRTAQQDLEDLGVDLDVRTPLERLTVGQKQLVEIVRAARLAPKVLIMDEPSSALGQREETLLHDLVTTLRDRGVGIVYITHRMEEVGALADRITVLRDGRHVMTAPAGEVDRDALIRSMVGRDVTDRRLGRPTVDPGKDPPRLALRDLRRPPHVNGVTLSVHAGEVVGLAGLVGAGRTETAELVYGVARPTGGEILLDGRPVRFRDQAAALAAGVGYVPEDRKTRGLVLGMSVEENLTLPRLRELTTAGVLRWSRLRQAAAEWIDRLRIKVAGGRQEVATLSGGNQQKVVIAKVLSRRPRVLILDEPTRGIDVGAKQEIHQLIRRIAEDGVAVLMISSELEEVLTVSDRIVVLRQGRVAGELPAAIATEEDVVRLAFGQRVPT